MWRTSYVVLACLLHIAASVKVKVVMHSDSQDDSRVEEEVTTPDPWEKRHSTLMPFIKKHPKHNRREKEGDDKTTTEKSAPLHPNSVLFPLIYKQSHINSMFMFDQIWYTWTMEKNADGTSQLNYYVCYKDPTHCDTTGWQRIDSAPRCAFEIDALLPDDRACINAFGVKPHNSNTCDGGEQIKVKDIVKLCGPRIRSLWRFVRAEERPESAAKPADVNSLLCEDQKECYINIEYRIHHDRITFALYEPERGQTFKSALKRDLPELDNKSSTSPPHHHHKKRDDEHKSAHVRNKLYFPKGRAKVEGKGVEKEKNDSGYSDRSPRVNKNKVKVRDNNESEDISTDI